MTPGGMAPMATACSLVVAVVAVSVILTGCGGGSAGGAGGSGRSGGGAGDRPMPTLPSTQTPAPTPDPTPGCTREQKLRHCTLCDPDTHACLTCSDGYGIETATNTCIALCLLPGWKTPQAPPVGVHHGISWPMECFPEIEAHFFGIGDWGGETPGKPVDNTRRRGHFRPGAGWISGGPDDNAQRFVATVMNNRAAAVASPKFVLSAGDNFYWGGIPRPCGTAGWDEPTVNTAPACTDRTFQTVFEDVYNGDALKNAPWFSVLGNHDFGGISFSQGWDYQLLRTYCPGSRFRMPGLYWHQKVQFSDFAVDVFMLDTNDIDALNGRDHGICQGNSVCNVPNATMSDPRSCKAFLARMYDEGMAWLDEQLAQSTAEWTIAVTHYPAHYKAAKWKELVAKHGLDVIFAGHTHDQELHVGPNDPNAGPMGKDFDGTWIVSGGGGGITSEGSPDKGGHDTQYGFVDFTISRESMTIEMVSHGGVKHEDIVMDKATITPKPKANLPHMHVESLVV